MLICILLEIYDILSRDDILSREKSLNPDNAFCFGLILMSNLSNGHIGCWVAYRF